MKCPACGHYYGDLTTDEFAKLHIAFPQWTVDELQERIEEAVNHTASKKAVSLYLYVRGWLRRDAEKLPKPYGGQVGDRDMSKFAPWAR